MKKVFRWFMLTCFGVVAILGIVTALDGPAVVRDAWALSIGQFNTDLWGNGTKSHWGFQDKLNVQTGTTYTLLDSDCGKIISNYGSTCDTAITWGTHSNGFYIYLADTTADNYTQSVNPPDAMTILQETNSAGDRISTTTAGFFGRIEQTSALSIQLEGAATSLLDDED